MSKSILYKQCYLQQNGMDEDCDSPWKTISLISIKDIKPLITLTQYKKTREFELLIAYPQIIRKKIINKNNQSSTDKET